MTHTSTNHKRTMSPVTPLEVFHVKPAANVTDLDRQLCEATALLRRACVLRARRDDRLTRAEVAAVRGRIDHLLDRRLELTRA